MGYIYKEFLDADRGVGCVAIASNGTGIASSSQGHHRGHVAESDGEVFGASSNSSSPVRVFGCCDCKTHLSTSDDILSKAFQGQHGKAYLFNRVVNVTEGKPQDRNMTTGTHTVRDIYCTDCQMCVGWKYVKAYEVSQRYKEGKYILERMLLSDFPL